MQRRSERLAILQQLNPICYRETGVKRVFKKIRRKRQSAPAETKVGPTTLEEKTPESRWSIEWNRAVADSQQPCCSKYLEDQRHLFQDYVMEHPPMMEPTMDFTMQQAPPLPVVGEPERPFKMKLVFLILIIVLGISFRFMSGFSSPQAPLKEAMDLKPSQQKELLQKKIQKDIDAFRQQVSGFQNFVYDFGSAWKHKKDLLLQSEAAKAGNQYIRMEDFALKSEGASVVKFSKSFKTGAKVCMLWSCWDYERSPDIILERINTPGNCWAMDGSEGYVVIKLTKPTKPSCMALYHIPRKISPTNEISSAPQNFSVYGFKSDFENEEGKFLGSFVYKMDGSPMQPFKLEGANLDTFQYLLLRISSNWNHPNYTCIYSVYVYNQ